MAQRSRIALRGLLVPVLLLASLAIAEAAASIQGTFTATGGSGRVFRGTWSADIASASDTVRGSWALLDTAGHVLLEGTWSMTRSGRGWQGAWSARVLTREPSSGRWRPGRQYSGTWQATTEDLKGTTLSEMFRQTLERQISGSWRSGPQKGNWWLNGSP